MFSLIKGCAVITPDIGIQAELQIQWPFYYNSVYIFLFLNKNICCDPSIKLSWQDCSNEESHLRLLWSNTDNYPNNP